jgi:hypothetical protein
MSNFAMHNVKAAAAVCAARAEWKRDEPPVA